ncbi:methyl-coenzyme M reductase [Acinetobacter sp. NRRL B-65365]|uniref:hypothetical protein n=1 Tax=Acinetobacter sp. NRRL B-65365 TaxID=1785092 RepID=UPI0007A0A83A|nr:hypothetical protein [Acinetobacter sp. NRRL B-65365]KYQ83565.1 methyl-coenzyme M reductase [Acinetobacter sp. NRRL B-65365]
MKIPVSQGVITGTTQRVGDAANPGGYRPDNAAMGVFSAIMGRQQQVWQKERAQEENSAKLQLDDVLTTDFSNKVTDLKNQVGNGVLSAEQANNDLSAWSNDRYAQLEENLPQHAKPQLKNYWAQSVNNQRSSFFPLQLRADEQKGVELVDRAFGIATRLPTQERESYFKTYLDNAPISEAEKSQRMQKLREESNKIDLDGRILSAVNSGSVDELSTLNTDLDKGAYGYLNGGQVQDYKASISSKIHTLQNRQQIEENKRLTESNKVFNEFKQSVLTGRNLDASYVDNVRTAVNGTDNQADFDFYMGHSSNFQKFSKLSTTEQLKMLNDQKALLKNSSSSDPVREEKVMNVYQSIYDEKIKLAKDNPSQILAENGIQLPDINPTAIKTNPQGLAKNLVTVGTYQLAMKKNDPNVAIKPISTDQLPQAIDEFDKSSVDQKLNLISNLIGQTKGITGGKQIWQETLKQLGSGSLNYVAAGTARLNNFKSTEGRELSTSIISGTQLLKNKQFTMPKEADLRASFNDYVGQTVSGTTANDAYEVFKAVYADTMVSRGEAHSKADELPNKEIAEFALGFTTGGIYDQDGGFRNYMGGKYQSWKVTKPYGMTDDAFSSRLDQGYNVIAQQTGISAAELKNLRLRQGKSSSTGELQYDLINERGQPLVVNKAVWRIKMSGVTK